MPLRKPRGAYHHGDLRDALVRATLAIVDRDGTGAVSLSAAARRVGVSPQASYNHFPAKADLLAAAAEVVMHQLTAAMLARAEGARTPGSASSASASRTSSSPRRIRRGFACSAFPSSRTRRRTRGCARPTRRRRWRWSGSSRSASRTAWSGRVIADKLARAAWATVHGVASLVIEGQLVGDPTALARETIRVLFKGLRATSRA